MHASSLNHEYKMYKLMGSSMTGTGVGWDVAGVVVAVGSGVAVGGAERVAEGEVVGESEGSGEGEAEAV